MAARRTAPPAARKTRGSGSKSSQHQSIDGDMANLSIDGNPQWPGEVEDPDQELTYVNSPAALELRAMEHPLREPWTFWYHNKEVSEDWLKCLLPVVTVDTLEKFWRVYLQMNPPTTCVMNREIYLFRAGIQPQWEDKRNKDGGRWSLATNPQEVDEQWQHLCMALVGEQFEEAYCDDVCGAVMHKKRNTHKFSMWTASHENEDSAMSIGRSFKEFVNGGSRSMMYEKHSKGTGNPRTYRC